MYFKYGIEEIEYLKKKDPVLGQAIDQIGPIKREVSSDLFSSVVHHIIGQQISSAAQRTVWKRLCDLSGTVNAGTLCACDRDTLQSCGMTYKKADYIKDFAQKVLDGEFDVEALKDLPDEDIVKDLSTLKGIGVWTAEMLMIFCLQRPDVVSYGDLAILRGMRMLYRHRQIDRKKFNRYARRYSPYGTTASLYLWAIAGGAVPEWKDPAPKKVKMNKKE